MGARLYVGTAGWSYPRGGGTWEGVFYPDTLADRDKLGFYAQYFNAVELNSSFYRPPSPFAARAWAKKVPEDFRFTAKLWQKFTHPKMFEAATGRRAEIADQDFETFLEGLGPLKEAGKLGPLLAQFPPSFKPDQGTLDYLEDLLRRLRREGFSLAVELRHRAWTEGQEAQAARQLMRDEGVAWVMIDEPRFRTSIGDVPLTNTQVGYLRFHGRNYQAWWHHEAAEDRYNYVYTPDEQQALAADVAAVADRTRETYAFYNNHYGAKAVVNALQLRMLLEGGLPPAPLPDGLLKAFKDLDLDALQPAAGGRAPGVP